MRFRRLFAAGLFLLAPAAASAQEAARQSEPVEALRDNPPGVHALTNATIVVAPGRVLRGATLVIRDGRVEAVGTNVRVPADATEHDMAGRTLYPGFIDAHAHLGLDVAPEEDEERPRPVHWNRQVRAQVDAGRDDAPDAERLVALREQGITVAHAVPRLGIFRGGTALLSLGDGSARQRVLRSDVAQSVAFSGSRELGFGYPNSPMGVIALIRQTLLDADWYRAAHAAYERNPAAGRRPETNTALAALDRAARGQQPLLVEARMEEEFFRARKIAEEFPVRLWLRGSGQEYRIAEEVAAAGTPLIVPLAFPDAPDVERPEDALDVSLENLRHWYLAPENPARLDRAGVEFSLTADGLEDADDFLPNLRRAVHRGLARDAALAALTTRPARLLGIERTHGTLETGKAANVVVVEGDLFDDDARVRDVWVDGVRYEVSASPRVDPRGRWLIASAAEPRLGGELELTGTPERLRGTLTVGGSEVRLGSANVRPTSGRLRVAFPGETLGLAGTVRLSGSIAGEEIHGWAELPDGTRPEWRAERSGVVPATAGAEEDDDTDDAPGTLPQLDLADIRPAMEYGRERLPAQPEHLLVTNATVWTQGPQGIVRNGDLLVRAGRVVEVGQGLQAPRGATVIDAQGRHVTPGLIDPHLHSGTHGVNEGGHAIVPEVRLIDVVTHNNLWMYRQLAGGLTTAHVKHGSANPIGGQNVFMKLRWGGLPHELILEGAPRTVKFALGENPRRREGRYPDTRMGTQQIIRDHFQAALDYQRAREEWQRTGEGLPPRRDLRMEALLDILSEDILVSSHGYRQDEFLMLIRLAQEFDFTIRTLQHGIEAYKIAPELAAAGVAAVVWSDWSSFKVEAYDATTYNARILTEAGVLTSLHSDNSAIASRMNWEAGKMLRTGMGEEDALALVTSSTARIMGIDDKVGSLEAGKDADFVIWSGHPLSQFTRAEQTWIDGRRYFDIDEDRALREQVERERARLLQLVLEDRRSGQGGNR
ncbi:MAG TPA: amidohydrolase family protein [Longimicrobiales bacterium]|nr:amidohydrolase family protein [Longimicrobiales bacterium]